MPLIKKSFISERLIPNVAIERLISQYVDLKKSGSNYSCCCPFHAEKSPSFVVSPSRQMFNCFGCHVHGNAIDFLMKYKNLGFVDAVEELAQYAGLQVEYEEGTTKSQAELDKYKHYYDLMDRCAALYTKVLNSPEGKVGLDYFKDKRELSEKTIVEARLGFAPKDPKFLINNLCKTSQDRQALIDLGMLIKGDYGIRSMYRNRVMIPIFDKKGRVISFGGRTMGDDKPKYMNTKETIIYKKRNELFGLYEALKANNNRPPRIVIVEGYMDVIALRQAGCTFAVASLGTATTKEQLQEIFRYTDKVVCCYDGDSAGRHAAWHALETVTPILKDGKEISFAFLPPEHDPDSLVRAQGLSSFIHYLDKAMGYSEFLILQIAHNYDITDTNGLSTMLNDAIVHIKNIPLPAVQQVALAILSKATNISQEMIYETFKNTKLDTRKDLAYKEPKEDLKKGNSSDLLKTPMRRLMAFIIQQPTVVASVYQSFALDTFLSLCKRLNIKGSEVLEQLLDIVINKHGITPANIIEITRDTNLENVVRTLMEAPLNLTATGAAKELPLVDRIEVLSEILTQVLQKPYKEKAYDLKLKMEQGNLSALKEYTAIQKEILSSDQ